MCCIRRVRRVVRLCCIGQVFCLIFFRRTLLGIGCPACGAGAAPASRARQRTWLLGVVVRGFFDVSGGAVRLGVRIGRVVCRAIVGHIQPRAIRSKRLDIYHLVCLGLTVRAKRAHNLLHARRHHAEGACDVVGCVVFDVGAQVVCDLGHLVCQLRQAERKAQVDDTVGVPLAQKLVAGRVGKRQRGAVDVAEQVGHLHAGRVLGVHIANLQVAYERFLTVHEDVADAFAHHVLEAFANAATHVERQAVGAAPGQLVALQVIGHGLGNHRVVEQLFVELAFTGVCRCRVDGEQVDLEVVVLEDRLCQGELLGGFHLRGLNLGLRGLVACDAAFEFCQVADEHHRHGEDLVAEAQCARLVQVQAQLRRRSGGEEHHDVPFCVQPRR